MSVISEELDNEVSGESGDETRYRTLEQVQYEKLVIDFKQEQAKCTLLEEQVEDLTIMIEEYKSHLESADERNRQDAQDFQEKLESSSIEIKELEDKIDYINNKNSDTTKRLRTRIQDITNRQQLTATRLAKLRQKKIQQKDALRVAYAEIKQNERIINTLHQEISKLKDEARKQNIMIEKKDEIMEKSLNQLKIQEDRIYQIIDDGRKKDVSISNLRSKRSTARSSTPTKTLQSERRLTVALTKLKSKDGELRAMEDLVKGWHSQGRRSILIRPKSKSTMQESSFDSECTSKHRYTIKPMLKSFS